MTGITEVCAPLVGGDKWDYIAQDGPRCPHCGTLQEIEDDQSLYHEGETKLTCMDCDKDFDVSVRVTFHYNTDKQTQGVTNDTSTGN